MKIALFGRGKMGQVMEKYAVASGHTIASLSDADVCIDFSHAQKVLHNLHEAVTACKSIVIGTTGWESEMEAAKKLIEESGIGALYSSNFSLGMAHFQRLLQQARSLFTDYDLAGVEYHHNQKKDAPSGTAKTIAHALEMKTPFTSVRCGSIAGKHEVIFDSPFDTITFSHEAHSREPFAKGALMAAEWMQNRTGWHTFDEMLGSLYGTCHPL